MVGHHLTDGPHSAAAGAGVLALAGQAGLAGRAVRGKDALGPAVRSSTAVAGQAGTHATPAHHTVAAVGSTEIVGTGVARVFRLLRDYRTERGYQGCRVTSETVPKGFKNVFFHTELSEVQLNWFWQRQFMQIKIFCDTFSLTCLHSTHSSNALPRWPGRQVQVGMWLMTLHWVLRPQVPGQGSTHLLSAQLSPRPQSEFSTHSGRQASAGLPNSPGGQEQEQPAAPGLATAPGPHGLGRQGSVGGVTSSDHPG